MRRSPLLLGLVAWVLLPFLTAGQEPSPPAPLSQEQREQLQERSRYAAEARKLRHEGKLAEAITAAEKMLAIERTVLGNRHDDVADSLELLAAIHEERAEFDTARKQRLEALAIRVEAHGAKHWKAVNARLALDHLDLLVRLPPAQRRQLAEADQLSRQFVRLYGQGHWNEALPPAQRALALRHQVLGDRHPASAVSLNNLGLLYWAQGQYDRAEPLYQQALAIRKELLGEQHPDYALSLNNLAVLSWARGQYDRAESLHRQALAIRKQVLGDKHPDYTLSLNNLASLYQARGDYARAEPLYQEALAIRKQVLGDRHPDYALSLHNLASLYESQGQYARAEPLYREALAIRKQVLGDQHPDYAHTLHNLADLRQVQGDYAGAEALYRQALAIRRQVLGDKHPAHAHTLHNLAGLYKELGDYARAEPLYQEALAIRRQVLGDRHPAYAQSLNHLAVFYKVQGNYTRAEALYQQALAIRKEVLGDKHPEYAQSLDNLAVLYWAQGDDARAESLHRQALAIRREALGTRHPDYALGLANLAFFYGSRKDFARAEPLYLEALAIRKQVLGEKHPDYAATLHNLAGLYHDQGDYARAEPLYLQALAIRRQALGDKHRASAISVNNLAFLYQDQKDYARAVALYQQAIATRCVSGGSASRAIDQLRPEDLEPLPTTLIFLGNYAYCLEKRAGAQPSAADLRACDQAYALTAGLLDRMRQEVLQDPRSKALHGAQAFAIFPRRIGVLRRLYDLEGRAADLESAFTTAEQGTARVFLEVLGQARARIQGGVPSELLAREDQLRRTLCLLDRRIDAEAGQPPDRLNQALIGQLQAERKEREAEHEALAARLKKAYPQYAALMHPRPCSLAQARACLSAREVALLFVPGPRASYVVLVEGRPAADDRANGLAIYPLPKEQELTRLVEMLTDRETLTRQPRLRARGRLAYQQLLAPLEERLRGKDLVIVPGGPLGYLPFELLVGPDGKFLVEGHRLRYAPSLTALHMIRQWEQTRARPDRPLWALGDPVFDAADPRATGQGDVAAASRRLRDEYLSRQMHAGSEGRPTFERLPATAAEVSAIRQTVKAGPAAVVTGLLASEATVKTASAQGLLARARYVHLATHGILGAGTGRQPALVLSLVGNDTEDGFLQLDEVTGLQLNADLVVLSACQSGQGQLARGEGVSSLGRAFLYAGSRGVLCSLWSVNDQETAHFMQQVYEHLQAGESAADALRTAQLAMLRDGKAPFYWAPFILIGE